MVNMIDSEKIIKHLITQFCDQQFKFTLNLKILGSIHVIVDNNEVLTCLLDEKYYKPNTNARNLIIPNNQFNPSSQQTDFNLVNTLNQLNQNQRCVSKMSVSTASNGKSSKSSSQSHSSSSSASSSSSYMLNSDHNNQQKRKRFTPKEDITDNESEEELMTNPSETTSVPSSNNNMQRTEDEMDDVGMVNEADSLEFSCLESQTPGKRNKLDNEYDNGHGSNVNSSAEAEAAAATLSLISVASKMNTFNAVQEPPVMIQEPVVRNKKSKIKSIIEEYNKNEQFQLQLQQQEQLRAGINGNGGGGNTLAATINAIASGVDDVNYESHDQNHIPVDSNHNLNESSSSEDHLYMDEGLTEREAQDKPSSSTTASSSSVNSVGSVQQHEQLYQQTQQYQQHQLMMAAATAIMNNNNNNNNQNNAGSNNGGVSGNNDNKLFMPQLALNMAVAKQQQHQNVTIPKKKKQRQNSIMSPLSSTSTSSSVSTNQTSKSISSASSTTSSTSSKGSKKARQTVASLAAVQAPSATINTSATNIQQNPPQNDLQRNLAALAQQFGIKDNSNFDQILHDMNSGCEKNKLLTPQPAAVKLSKKAHLLAARSANNTPCLTGPSKGQKIKTKKSQFQDASNLVNAQNMAPSNSVAQAAAAAAYRYQQLLSQVGGNTGGNNVGTPNGTPQKPGPPKYNMHNANMYNSTGYYPKTENMDEESQPPIHNNNEDVENEATDQNCDNEKDLLPNNNMLLPHNMPSQMGTAGSINFKSLNANNPNSNIKQENQPQPLNNMNNQSNMNNHPMGPNLEFECAACDKRFKYYCYYKRHMDACHSDNPKYVCDTCNKSYKWEASFRQHLRSHHIDENCKDGGDGVENLNNLNGGVKPDVYQNLKMSFQNSENQNSGDYDDGEYRTGVDDSDCDENEYGENEYEAVNKVPERDTEQMGAAGALASIADSINSMIQTQSMQIQSQLQATDAN